MTDADNTASTAEAEYKDIKVGYKKMNRIRNEETDFCQSDAQ